jgi:hypothetical protein
MTQHHQEQQEHEIKTEPDEGRKPDWTVVIIFGSMLSILIAIGAWNLSETIAMGKSFVKLQQFVDNGREQRIKLTEDNEKDHNKYEFEIKRLDKDIAEIKLRTTILERAAPGTISNPDTFRKGLPN